MWPPVIWIGKWLVKEAVLTVAAHYAMKFAKKKLKGKDHAEVDKDAPEEEGEETGSPDQGRDGEKKGGRL